MYEDCERVQEKKIRRGKKNAREEWRRESFFCGVVFGPERSARDSEWRMVT